MVFPRLEHRYLPELVSTISVSSAMAIGSAVASGTIALTGIVFSLAFVMVQFSATAYSTTPGVVGGAGSKGVSRYGRVHCHVPVRVDVDGADRSRIVRLMCRRLAAVG